jgi:hypothetical protein
VGSGKDAAIAEEPKTSEAAARTLAALPSSSRSAVLGCELDSAAARLLPGRADAAARDRVTVRFKGSGLLTGNSSASACHAAPHFRVNMSMSGANRGHGVPLVGPCGRKAARCVPHLRRRLWAGERRPASGHPGDATLLELACGGCLGQTGRSATHADPGSPLARCSWRPAGPAGARTMPQRSCLGPVVHDVFARARPEAISPRPRCAGR